MPTRPDRSSLFPSPNMDPNTTDPNIPDAAPLLALLDRHAIHYRSFDHAAVFTCEEAQQVVPESEGAIHSKNLFLRDKRGRRHFLLVTTCEKAVDLKGVAKVVSADTLSLGSPERLWKHLGVTPGAVTLLALMNDTDRQVELVIDREVWSGLPVRCHPLVNTATLVLEHAQLQRFLALTGHVPLVVDVPARVTG
jgi:Ala-tRNA(Pro) deacylase